MPSSRIMPSWGHQLFVRTRLPSSTAGQRFGSRLFRATSLSRCRPGGSGRARSAGLGESSQKNPLSCPVAFLTPCSAPSATSNGNRSSRARDSLVSFFLFPINSCRCVSRVHTYPTTSKPTRTKRLMKEHPPTKIEIQVEGGKGSTQMVAIWRPANRVCVNHCCFDRKKWESDNPCTRTH